MNSSRLTFDWNSPPWQGGVVKYRLGLQPIQLADWFDAPISDDLFAHKKKLLDEKYEQVVQVTEFSEPAQRALASNFAQLDPQDFAYPDTIAHLGLQVADDLCLIESGGEQRMLAASVCSPTYWDVRDKIGCSLVEIHGPVATLEEKIGYKIARFINNAPVLQPFERVNWFIHADQDRFHLKPVSIQGEPESWFVRSERETVCRFHEDFALFTINPRFARLAEIHEYPEATVDLIKSLSSFDQKEIDYFGGAKKHRLLLEYLRNP
ncbi:MAG: DUF3445 domain-containing protein [Pseudomonadales bacterium]|nr:DUF3445 domain-containing protein [Pseudomonadales bacterium]